MEARAHGQIREKPRETKESQSAAVASNRYIQIAGRRSELQVYEGGNQQQNDRDWTGLQKERGHGRDWPYLLCFGVPVRGRPCSIFAVPARGRPRSAFTISCPWPRRAVFPRVSPPADMPVTPSSCFFSAYYASFRRLGLCGPVGCGCRSRHRVSPSPRVRVRRQANRHLD